MGRAMNDEWCLAERANSLGAPGSGAKCPPNFKWPRLAPPPGRPSRAGGPLSARNRTQMCQSRERASEQRAYRPARSPIAATLRAHCASGRWRSRSSSQSLYAALPSPPPPHAAPAR